MSQIGQDGAALLLWRWVEAVVAGPCALFIMIVITPLSLEKSEKLARWHDLETYKVVGKLMTRSVCRRILKVNNNELLVFVCWKEKRRFLGRFHPEKVAILSLIESVSKHTEVLRRNIHRCEQTQADA